MSRVFVIEPTKLDVIGASRFGEMIYIWPHGSQRPSIWDASFKQATLARLAELEYDIDADYLLIAGHTVALVITVAAIMAEYEPGGINVLFFDSVSRQYVTKLIGDTAHAQHSN